MLRALPVLLFILSVSSASAHEWPEGKPLPTVERWHAPLAWPTTDWVVLSEDGEALTGVRATGAAAYRNQLVDASQWYESVGFRAPAMYREGEDDGGPLGRYIGFMKAGTEGLGANYTNEREEYSTNVVDWAIELIVDYNSPARRFYLSGNPKAWAPETAVETLMSGAPAHELFHAVQAAYGGRRGAPSTKACQGTGASLDWIWEGSASAAQIRWLERSMGTRHAHTYDDPSRATWTRYYDHSLHRPRHNPPDASGGVSWLCGYGNWTFWYAVGEMLAKQPGQEIGYLHHVFSAGNDWSDYGLRNLDEGLKEAAEQYGSPNRYDEGLFEIYPEFIAEYVDDERFYEAPEALHLRGRSEVKWTDGVIEPLAAKAFKVTINVDDNMPADRPSRFIVTLDPQANRDQLHLIDGQQVYSQPLADEDPYSFVVPVRRDTTFFVRLANVAEDAAQTEGTQYSIRFELGGFYGAPASGPYVAPDVDIPPGFAVMSGPPSLVGCSGGVEGGSVFDLITAAEATGDIRRVEDGANQMLEDMDESLEDGEFPIPGATPEQRAAMRRAIESGAISQAQIAEMRAAIAQAQAEMAQAEPEFDETRAEIAQEYRGRSRLLATFVGQSGNETCQVIISAALRGEEGGAQQLSVADDSDLDDGDPMAVGIESVGYLVGSVQDMLREGEPFQVCMMTPEEQAQERESSCPVVCTAGQLTLDEASQGHAKGMLRVDLTRSLDGEDARGCPRVERRDLVLHFNITSANSGQDADMMRGISDETLRAMGMDQAAIDAMRSVSSGQLFR